MSIHTQQNATLNNHRNNVHTSDGIEVPSHYKWGMGFIHMHIQSSKRVHTIPILKKEKEKDRKSVV